jgi:hypothetical protein
VASPQPLLQPVHSRGVGHHVQLSPVAMETTVFVAVSFLLFQFAEQSRIRKSVQHRW